MKWTNVKRKLSELEPWTRNPRQINASQAKRLQESFDQFGQVETIAIGPDNQIYNGHQRLNVLMEEHGGDYKIECRQSDKA
ncbi:ParB N-terminal domain-containing protein, partial [bacterium]|nr:ParB N-terminal domain-containing protein [bacterium]